MKKKEEYRMKTKYKLILFAMLILFLLSLFFIYQDYINDDFDYFSGHMVVIYVILVMIFLVGSIICIIQWMFPKSKFAKKLEDWFEKVSEWIVEGIQ